MTAARAEVAAVRRQLATLPELSPETIAGMTDALTRALEAMSGPRSPGFSELSVVDRVIRRDDDIWMIAFDNRNVRLRDSKGLHDLARMVQHPGKPLTAVELVAAHSPEPARAQTGGAPPTPRTRDLEAERARKAVRFRVRSTIRTIRAEHPALGEHLDRFVSTGHTCMYSPPDDRDWYVAV